MIKSTDGPGVDTAKGRRQGLFAGWKGGPERRQLFENIFSLGLLQGANYLLPLVTIPYLVRILEPEKFGLISFAQSFAAYFVILTDYGFNLSATREIALCRNDKRAVSEIFSSVLIIKMILMLAGLMALLAIAYLVPRFRTDLTLYLLSYGVVMGNILLPVWYFQGMEKMKYIAYMNILAKAISAAAIFIFIRGMGDYILVPVINSLGFMAAGIIGLVISLKMMDFLPFRATPPSRAAIRRRFKEGTKLFQVFFYSKLFTSSGVFFAGLFFGNVVAGFYSAVEKLILPFKSMLTPIPQALYPYLTRKTDAAGAIRKYLRLLPAAALGFLILTAILYLFSETIVQILFGSKFAPAAEILRIVAPIFLFAALYILIGYHIFLAVRRDREFVLSVAIPAIFFVVATPVLLSLYNDFQLFLGLLIFAEAMVLGIRVFFLWRLKRAGNL